MCGVLALVAGGAVTPSPAEASRPAGSARSSGPPVVSVTALVGPDGCEPCGGDGAPMRTATRVNERGQVAGTSYASPLAPVAVLWQSGSAVRLAPESQPLATPTDLSERGQVVGGTFAFPPLPFSWAAGAWSVPGVEGLMGGAVAVNGRRDVLIARLVGLPATIVQVPALWRDGALTPWPLGEAVNVRPIDLNDRRQALVLRPAGPGRPPESTAVWQPSGTVTELGTLGGATATGADINGSGVVVGTSETADGSHRAFAWRAGEGMTDLGTLGGAGSRATAVNDRGDVVGAAATAGGTGHAVLWRRGRAIDLGTLGGPDSWATAVNERGDVVGVSLTATGERHAFLWRGGHMVDLGALAGVGESTATDINDRGQVVGSVGTGMEQRAVLWTVRAG